MVSSMSYPFGHIDVISIWLFGVLTEWSLSCPTRRVTLMSYQIGNVDVLPEGSC